MQTRRTNAIQIEVTRQELVLLRFLAQDGAVLSLLRRHKQVLLENNPNFPGGREEIKDLAHDMHITLCDVL